MDNRGFTLAELLAGLGMGSIIVLAMASVYVFATRTGIENDSQAYLQRQAALINDEMAMRIRAAVPVGTTPALAITTCSGVANSLQVNYLNPPEIVGNPGSLGAAGYHVLCYRRDSSTGTNIIRDHCPPDGSGNPQPGCASPDRWNLLSGASAALTTPNGPTLSGANCGAGAGFCPGATGSAPTITNYFPDGTQTSAATCSLAPAARSCMTTVTFQLQYPIPETTSFQTMTFTTNFYQRNPNPS